MAPTRRGGRGGSPGLAKESPTNQIEAGKANHRRRTLARLSVAEDRGNKHKEWLGTGFLGAAEEYPVTGMRMDWVSYTSIRSLLEDS